MKSHLILASSSPRRKALLQQVNIPFTLRSQKVDETVVKTMDPVELVKELALLKGRSTKFQNEMEVILTADTIVALNNDVYGKPHNRDGAREMLHQLSGRVHQVYTGVMIRSATQEVLFYEKTDVEFWQLTDDEIEMYLETGDSFDKAGAYGIQGQGAILVKRIVGDYFTVVGLPISRTVRELRKFSILPCF